MKLKYLLMGFASLALFASCETDEPSNIVAEYQTPTTFVLNTPQFANGVYDLLNAGSLNFTFSQPDYGYSAACDYTVEVSSTADFAEGTTGVVSTVFNLCDINVDANDFAMAVCSAYGWENQEDVDAALSASENGTMPVYVRIWSQLSNAYSGYEDSAINDSRIASNAIELNVIPYFALPPVELPANMWMNGQFCSWDWANAVKMVPVNGVAGKFWCIRYVGAGAGQGFKFSFSNNWDTTNFGYADNVTMQSTVEGVEFADDGGNITISKEGWYVFGVTVTVTGRDFNFAVDVFPADVWVYGLCTGKPDSDAWGDDPNWKFTVPTTPDGEFVSPALAATAELRLCVHPLNADGSQWAGDWWTTEFLFFDGKISYRGTGGDQERVTVNQGLQVHLNFITGEASAK